ncbi:MAG: class I SAM-dependent RNA methyltransferase [Chloroflexota bacterium]
MPSIVAEAPVYGGLCLGRWKGKVVLLKGALPGEVVVAAITGERKGYCTASVVEIIEPSPDRITPHCPLFETCGGCHLQYTDHSRQITLKEAVLKDCLRRIAGLAPELSPAILSPDAWHYRRRGQFKVSDGEVGFYREKSRDLVSVARCPLMINEINERVRMIGGELSQRLTPVSLHAVSEIQILHGDSAVAAVKTRRRGIDERFVKALWRVLSKCGFDGLAVVSDNAVVARAGDEFTGLQLGSLTYTVSPSSFIQSNWAVNEMLVAFVRNALQPLTGKRVLDLFSGAGNFALSLARDAEEVIAVEEDPVAISDGRRNVQRNALGNCRFVRSSAEGLAVKDEIHVLVVDPPRPGLTSKTFERILGLAPETIVYVSCNPSTLARDLKNFAERYTLESVRMIDFFPQTYHIESMAILRLR